MLNRPCLPSDIIALVAFCRLRYRLTRRDLSEILLLRGIVVSHEAIRDWETKLLPVMGNELRKRRHGTRRGARVSWYIDETYLKVRGQWVYLYRVIDRDGNLIDAMLSQRRDMTAAKAFFCSAKATPGLPAGSRHYGRPWLLSKSDPHRAGAEGAAPDQRLLE